MRCSGGTNFGLAWSVVACTNSFMAAFAAPSSHEGSGSVCARACVPKAAANTKAKSARTSNLMAVSSAFCLIEHARGETLRQDRPEDGGGQHQHEHRVEHRAVQHALTGPIDRLIGDKCRRQRR